MRRSAPNRFTRSCERSERSHRGRRHDRSAGRGTDIGGELTAELLFPCAKILNQFQVLLRKITYRIPSWLRVCLLILWGLAWAGFGIPWNGMTNHAHWGVIRCSLTTELIQVFSHTRTPTLLDVVVNTAGTIVGVALQSRIHSRARPREDVA